MTIPNLPPQGSTSWYDWATSLDTEARKVASKLDTATASATYLSQAPGTGLTEGATKAELDAETTAREAAITDASATDRDRVNHTGVQDISTVTGLQAALDAKVAATDSVGYQTWNGTAWSTRPTGFGHVEAYSDGTRGSTSDTAAPAPTGAVDGDRWWKATA